MKRLTSKAQGYSLIELMVAAVLFTIISGAVFSLLYSSQLTYQGESTIAAAFQQANVAIDQIVRDVHSSGYPPISSFNTAVVTAHPEKFALPFAWSPNYPFTPCTVGVCAAPGESDLILEADSGTGFVQWIRYSLVGTTLKRGVTPKAYPGDPLALTDGDLLPYLDNVVNQNQSPAPPVFSYCYDSACDAGVPQIPGNIQRVNITLFVQSAQRDAQSNQFRTIKVTGQAARFNPNQ
jgi:prepilin-type N-terminal cleavage/methylation domain-containing protein